MLRLLACFANFQAITTRMLAFYIAASTPEAKKTAALKTQVEKLQQERGEFQRMVIGNQQKRTLQIHELKKKEKEYINLQERLNQMLMEKKKESRSDIEMMNLLQVDTYEAKNQELMVGIADLIALSRSLLKFLLVDKGHYRCPFSYQQLESPKGSQMFPGSKKLMQLKNDKLGENVVKTGLLFKKHLNLGIVISKPPLSRWTKEYKKVDMRNFLNAPNGLPTESLTVNVRVESDPTPSPLVGRKDVFDLPFDMARDQIEESPQNKDGFHKGVHGSIARCS